MNRVARMAREGGPSAGADEPVSLVSGAQIGITDILNGELACQLRALIAVIQPDDRLFRKLP